MFFSPELLLKRESGLGLLWLAATIGAKASFKKLNRKSILNADIAELCEQIMEPEQPLALRLSSNLLVGVVRVHRAKFDIFHQEVISCSQSLKRAGIDLITVDDAAQKQLTLTKKQLNIEPNALFDVQFDFMDGNWLDAVPQQADVPSLPSQDDFPSSIHSLRPSSKHLLQEMDYTSNDPYQPNAPEDVDLFWPDPNSFETEIDLGIDMGMGYEGEVDDQRAGDAFRERSGFPDDMAWMDPQLPDPQTGPAASLSPGTRTRVQPNVLGSDDLHAQQMEIDQPPDSQAVDFGTQIDSQVLDPDFTFDVAPSKKAKKNLKKRKSDAMWDAEIELADADLHASRNGIDRLMKTEKIARDAKIRKEKASALVQGMLLDSFLGATDSGLSKFWTGLLKTRYDDHSNAGRNDGFAVPSLPPAKRPRTSKSGVDYPPSFGGGAPFGEPFDFEAGAMEFDGMQTADFDLPVDFNDEGKRPSAPGTPDYEAARRRGSSLLGSTPLASNARDSKRSSIFPWSSAKGTPAKEINYDSMEAYMDEGTGGGESSSQQGGMGSQDPGISDTQATDMSLMTLQRTMETDAFQFLKHLTDSVDETMTIALHNILEPSTMSRRVAATGFYHALVLSTKDHIKLRQDNAYGPIQITLKNN